MSKLPKAETAVYALLVLTLINLVNYLDRYLIAALLPRIEDDLRIGHDAAGFLGTAFVVVYMFASPLGGFLADRTARRWVVAVSVILWSLATIGSGLSRTYPELLIARAAVGIGEAGYASAAPAMISDIFAPERRTRTLAIFYTAMPVGAALGYALGGWIGAAYSWHAAFYAGGVPGLLLAAAMLAVREGPARNATVDSAPRSFQGGLSALATNRPFWICTASQTLTTFSIGGLAYWMPTFFEKERGLSPGKAGLIFGAITALAGIFGTLTGGFLGDWADRRSERGGLWISGWGLVAAGPLIFLSAWIHQPALAFAALFAAELATFVNSGPVNAAICTAVPSALRASAMGLNVLIIHLLGDAVSPPLIGAVARHSSLALSIELNALPVLIGGLILLL